MPLTHPAPEINGILVPGYLAPDDPSCFPPEILDELREACSGYNVYSSHERQTWPSRRKLEGYLRITEKRKDAALYLAQRYAWDLLFLQFQKTDAVFHSFKREKDHLQLYKCVDRCIGELIQKLGREANVIIVSDHGMCEAQWIFYLNQWLRKQGFLECHIGAYSNDTSLKKEKEQLEESAQVSSDRIIEFLRRINVTPETLDHVLQHLGLGFFTRMIPPAVLELLPQPKILWSQTQAYCPSFTSLGVRLNVRGREPEGIVDPNQYEIVREDIMRHLEEVLDPDGKRAFTSILRREECYIGPQTRLAPDIVIVPREFQTSISTTFAPWVFRRYRHYSHHLNGLFVAWGPDIVARGQHVKGVNILDVAPTVLQLMGIPVPEDMDGVVLSEIIRPLAKAEIFPSSNLDRVGEGEASGLSKEEEAEVVEHLRGLGYIE